MDKDSACRAGYENVDLLSQPLEAEAGGLHLGLAQAKQMPTQMKTTMQKYSEYGA